MKPLDQVTNKEKKLLYALALMYNQYCGSKPFGHNFMGAGEEAIELLEDYGLANEQTGVNQVKLDELEKSL